VGSKARRRAGVHGTRIVVFIAFPVAEGRAERMLKYGDMNRMLPTLALASLLAACATAPKTGEQAHRPWNSVPLEEVRITAERSTDDRKDQHVVIYGNGTALWNNSVQFRVDAATIRQMLASFDAAAFETIPPRSPKGKLLRRRAAIRAGAYEHEAWDTWEQELARQNERETIRRSNERKGIVDPELEKEPALTTLVDSIITRVLPLVETGAGAESLADGLKKIASGQLAPEALTLTMLVKPEPGRGETSGGFLLKIDGGSANWSDFQGEQGGFTDARKIKLSAARLREIAARLATFDPGSMPINLYSPKYEEVTLSVLNRQQSIVARQFAGMTPTKHGEAQTRFDAMSSWLTSTAGELAGKRR
jgi:hypothetical protein